MPPLFAGVLEVVRLADGVGLEVVGVTAWDDLLHLEGLSRTASDDRLGPRVDRLALLAPVCSSGSHSLVLRARAA